MSLEDLQTEVAALKSRIESDKEAMSQLKNENESLLEKLDVRKSPVSAQSSINQGLVEGQDGAGGGANLAAGLRERIVYLPKEKKCPVFNGGSSAAFYEWLDEINATLVYRSYNGAEKAAYFYEHLGGEARQEIKYRTQTERSDPVCVLEILHEIYGQPQSLTKLQKQFFDRRQREGESVREYSHALMAIMEEINHCKVKDAWCGDFALRDQFAENVCDVGLRRELKKTIRQQPTISFFQLRKEALQWEEEAEGGVERRRRVVGSCEKVEATPAQAQVVTATMEAKPDPMLTKVLDMLHKQQVLIDDLSKKFTTTMQVPGSKRTEPRKWQPRYDASGQPICFKCHQAGHIARVCVAPRAGHSQDVSATVLPTGRDGSAQILEQQGNSSPLW